MTQPSPEAERPFAKRLLRALARRFPRTRRAYNYSRAKLAHLARGFRPRRARATFRWLADFASLLRRRRGEQRLTVGLEITAFWEPLTGIGWYLYRLLEELADRDDVRLRLYGPTVVDSPDLAAPDVEPPAGAALERVLYRVPDGLMLPRGWLIRLLRRLEPLLLAADGNDVLFAPNYFLPRRFHLARGARVATIHDLGVRAVPWTLRGETHRMLADRLEHAVFEASRLITVSEAVKRELTAFGYAEPDRVHAIHHGPGQLSRVEPGELPGEIAAPFALHVGTLEPRKNILGLLDAWRELERQRGGGAPLLVLCGRYGWKTRAIRAAVEAAERAGRVRHLGYVGEPELAALYRSAAVVVFPSLYEGFGLPAIEALHAGSPLVCSDIPVLREVAGDAALYAPPERPDLLAERVAEVLDSPETAARLRRRGQLRAGELSWAVTAEKTLRVWAEAGGRP